MESPAIVISGGSPVFHTGAITINITPSSSKATRVTPDQTDDLCVRHSEERAFHDHRGNERFYQITQYPKGRVLIINNEFRGQGLRERTASSKDRAEMVDLWEKLGCQVTPMSDLTANKMLFAVTDFAASKLQADFGVLIVMSHGKQDDLVVGNEQGEIEVARIVNIILNSQRFKGKPKLMFFQICRGRKVEDRADSGAFDTEDSTWIMSLLNKVLQNGRILGSRTDETDKSQRAEEYISNTPDVLLAFATQPDHISFRRQNEGTWFIQSIKRVFANHAATLDVVKLMEKVREEVRTYTASASGTKYDGGKETVDGKDTFGNKRLMLFPGFPSPIPDV